MIKKQITAVEWLVEQVNSDCTNSTFIRPEHFQKAIDMETEQLDNAFKLGLEFGAKYDGKSNNLDKVEFYEILKNILSVDDNLISKNPKLLSFIEGAYAQLNRAEGMTMDILRSLNKNDIINPSIMEVINQIKNSTYGL